MHNESFYLDFNDVTGDTLKDYTTSILITIKSRLYNNQFAHKPFMIVSTDVVSGIHDSLKTFLFDSNKIMGFYVDYSFENRADSQYCEITQVKVSLCL